MLHRSIDPCMNKCCKLVLLYEEWKIHVSPETKAILDTFNTFQLDLRGPVEMKVCLALYLKSDVVNWSQGLRTKVKQ